MSSSGSIKSHRIRSFLEDFSKLIESGFDEEQVAEAAENIAAMDPNATVGDGYDCRVVADGVEVELEIAAFNAPGNAKEIHIHGLPAALTEKVDELFVKYSHYERN